MGWGMGRTGMGSRPLRSREPMPEKSSRAPPYNKLGRTFCFTWSQWARRIGSALPDPLLLAPDPFSWHIAHQTRHNLGSYPVSLPESCVGQCCCRLILFIGEIQTHPRAICLTSRRAPQERSIHQTRSDIPSLSQSAAPRCSADHVTLFCGE